MERKQKPDHEIRRGNVRVTLWYNRIQGRRGGWYSVTISRIYRNRQGIQSASSLGYHDLKDAQKALRRARWWIWLGGGAPSRKRW